MNETVTELLGFQNSLDDMSSWTDYLEPQHHAAIREAFWQSFDAAIESSPAVAESSRDSGRLTLTGEDADDLREALQDAADAATDAAQAMFDAHETEWGTTR